tara:strand:+ start:323 stop:928 length:606 start_codon:yes stop_codon:yes gene_type:complete
LAIQDSYHFRSLSPLGSPSRTLAVASGWTYGCCSLDAPAQSFGPFAKLVETWQSRRLDGSTLPARRAFEMEDFRDWLGQIFIAKIEQPPFDLRYTLWGTTLVDWWGIDYTGRFLGNQSENPDSWNVERRYFETMSRAPFIGLAGGLLTQHNRDHVKVLGLDLPLGDGSRMDRVLSAHLRINFDDDVGTIVPNCPITPFEGE